MEEKVWYSYPIKNRNVCAACYLENHEGQPLSLFEEAPADGVCDCCGERFDSERAEEGNLDVLLLSFM